MAVQQCTSCGERFRHDLRGRPPKVCPTCRSKGKSGSSRYMDKFDRPFIVNKFAGECTENIVGGTCGTHVEAGQGFSIRIGGVDGRWQVRCQAHRPIDREGRIPTPPTPTLPPPVPSLPSDDAGTVDVEGIIGQVLDRLPATDLDTLRKLTVEEIETRLPELLANIGKQEINLTIDDVKVDLPNTHHAKLPTLIHYLSLGFHVFMPGPAGAGKSTMAIQAAKSLNLPFGSISFGPTTPNSKLFGFIDANGHFQETEFYKAYACQCDDDTYDENTCECGGIFLADEMDNAHPGLLAELNQALANPYCAFANGMARKGGRFRMIATGNTFGKGPSRQFQGRNVLDAATLDRFWTMETLIDEIMERTIAMAYSKPGNGVAGYINLVQSVRAKAVELKMLIIVSPRACIEGAKAIASGIEVSQVIEDRLLPGIEADTRRQLGIMGDE